MLIEKMIYPPTGKTVKNSISLVVGGNFSPWMWRGGKQEGKLRETNKEKTSWFVEKYSMKSTVDRIPFYFPHILNNATLNRQWRILYRLYQACTVLHVQHIPGVTIPFKIQISIFADSVFVTSYVALYWSWIHGRHGNVEDWMEMP